MSTDLWHPLYDHPGRFILPTVVLGALLVAILTIAASRSPRRVRTAARLALAAWALFVVVASLIGPPNLARDLPRSPIGFTPFSSIATTPARTTSELLGNLVLFAPLGVLLTFVAPTWRLGAVAAIAVSFGLILELGQWLANTGRHATVDDALLAATGASLGWLLTRFALRMNGVRTEPLPDR